MSNAALSNPPTARLRTQAAVSAAFPHATEAASGILRQGGNAIDAAVAAAWALSVCEPSASGLGGQTTMLFSAANGDVKVIDGHSYAPRRVSESTVSLDEQRRGYRSCTIPSTPATLQYAHSKYGRLSWQRVMAPAAEIAKRGFALTALQCKQTGWVLKHLRANPAAGELFLNKGEPPQVGETLRQPQLAETLHRIAEAGAIDFYQGTLARDIGDDMRDNGGLLDEEDLGSLSAPIERPPLMIKFRGFEVVTVPPPGGGLQLLLALKILEQLFSAETASSVEDGYAAIAISIFGAFCAREENSLVVRDFVPELGARLLSEEWAGQIIDKLCRERHASVAAAEEPGDTTHLTVADAQGNIVALTQSIQSVFGAKVANNKLGFLYNNYLRTCLRSPGPSQLGPNCLSRSNAAPVLIRERISSGQRPILALGSAGSRRITSSILQVISNVVDHKMPLQEAIAAPRIHALLSRKLWVEKRISLPSLVGRLGDHFSKFIVKGAYSFGMGAVHALQFVGGETIAGADPRRDGSTAVLQNSERE
jgi:gamma-glutamyltranspeptidase / glutathione hydrolase